MAPSIRFEKENAMSETSKPQTQKEFYDDAIAEEVDEMEAAYNTAHNYESAPDEVTEREIKVAEMKAILAASSPPSSLEIQHDGGHYKGLAIQPIEYCQRNNLKACESFAIKHITRHRDKGEGAIDLTKALHYIQMALEFEYGVKAVITYPEEEPNAGDSSSNTGGAGEGTPA